MHIYTKWTRTTAYRFLHPAKHPPPLARNIAQCAAGFPPAAHLAHKAGKPLLEILPNRIAFADTPNRTGTRKMRACSETSTGFACASQSSRGFQSAPLERRLNRTTVAMDISQSWSGSGKERSTENARPIRLGPAGRHRCLTQNYQSLRNSYDCNAVTATPKTVVVLDGRTVKTRSIGGGMRDLNQIAPEQHIRFEISHTISHKRHPKITCQIPPWMVATALTRE